MSAGRNKGAKKRRNVRDIFGAGDGAQGQQDRRPIVALNRLQLQNQLGRARERLLGDKPLVGTVAHQESRDRQQGIDRMMWRDAGGSNLFLRVLAQDGAITPNRKVSLGTVAELTNQVDEANIFVDTSGSLPGHIAVQTADTPEARLAAKNMLRDLVQEAQRDDPTRVFSLDDSADSIFMNPLPGGHNQVALTFRVISKPRVPSLITADNFKGLIGEEPDKGSRYETVVNALNNLNTKLKGADLTIIDIDKQQIRDGANMLQRSKVVRDEWKDVNDSANQLIGAIDDYIKNSGTNVFSKASRAQKSSKKDAMAQLKSLVVAAKNDEFKSELDRLKQTRLATVKQEDGALDESRIIPGTRQVIGDGAQGDVYAATLRLPNNVDFRAALKPDNALVSPEAVAFGVPENNPQQSARAVATYKISHQIGLDVIPRTEFAILSDAEGRPQLGQALGFVRGMVGQLPLRIRADDAALHVIQQAQATINNVNSNSDAVENAQYTLAQWKQDANGYYREFKDDPRVINVAYQNPALQKDLADLQVLDHVVGAADRHPGNFIYVTDDNGRITGVRGIDNDDTFGSRWVALTKVDGRSQGSKTPRVPPFVDFQTALKILRMNPAAVANQMKYLSQNEKNATVARLREVQDQVKERVQASVVQQADNDAPTGIASIGGAQPVQNEVTELLQLAELDVNSNLRIEDWSNQRVFNAHNENNSYLGEIRARAQVQGMATPNRVDTYP